MIRDFHRLALFRLPLAPIESIQDVLEGALSYNTNPHIKYNLVCADSEAEKPYSYYNQICDLAESGYLKVQWEDANDIPDFPGKRLVTMTLTIEGQKLLKELRE